MKLNSLLLQVTSSTVSAEANKVWGWIQVILIFVLVVLTVIGILVTYSKKNSENPGEFKKYVMGFLAGIIFLIIALALVGFIKGQLTSSLGGISF